MATDNAATWLDELALIEAVLKGYPNSIAKADALRAVRVLQATPPAPAPVQKPEHLQQGVDALVSAAGTALEVLEKHRQIKGETPMGMLGVRAIEELKEAFGLLHPHDDYEPPAQPAVPDV